MKKTIFLVLFGVLFSTALFASSSKQSEIRKLIKLTGADTLGIQVMNQMIVDFKPIVPNVPEKFWTDFMKEANTDGLIELIIPFYDKYFTENDIKEMIEFYNTPVGKKTIKLMPQIMQESMLAGQEWGKELGAKIAETLKDEGYM